MKTTSIVAASAILFSVLSSGTSAQQQSQTPPPPPCTADDNFRAFDFWIGEWEVTPWAGGAVQGHNVIQPEESGCVLTEHWTNIQGGTGQSINF